MDKQVFKRTNTRKEQIIDLSVKPEIDNSKAGNKLSYLYFALYETRVKYGIEIDDMLFFLYLYELKYFKTTVNILGVKWKVEPYISLGYVLPDIKHKNKKYFTITDKLIEVVKYFVSILNNRYNYINENRVVGMDFDSVVKSILSEF